MDLTALLSSAGLVDFAALPAENLPLLGGKRLPQGMKSVIVCLFPYFTGFYPGRNISLYALSADYHTLAGGMLKEAAAQMAVQRPHARLTTFVDASPIDEVAAAHRAGLGDRGQNGLLITPRWGQFVFIGCILTDLGCDELGLSARQPPRLCDRCDRCVAACPTGALSPGGFERTRCRSEITQKKGDLTEWESNQVAAGGLVWGCDHCLLACPHNQAPEVTPIPAFKQRVLPVLTGADIDNIDDRAYLWRGRTPLRRNLGLISKGPTSPL